MCPPSAFNSNQADHPTQPPLDISTVIPNNDLCKAAYNHASTILAPEILNHSIRVYLYAKALAQQTTSTYFSDPNKHDLLFTACLFHDIGTTSMYNGPQRFEVEGGDAAVKFLSGFNKTEDEKHDVWMAISLHTSAGITERINELTRLVRKAVLTDFGRNDEIEGFAEMKTRFESQFARGEIEKVLGDAVVEQVKGQPGKASSSSWANSLYQAYLAEPDWKGVNKGF